MHESNSIVLAPWRDVQRDRNRAEVTEINCGKPIRPGDENRTIAAGEVTVP